MKNTWQRRGKDEKGHNVPNNQFPKRKRDIRNRKIRDFLMQYRRHKKEIAAALQNDINQVDNQRKPPYTSGYDSAPSDNQNGMQVRMSFPHRANGP